MPDVAMAGAGAGAEEEVSAKAIGVIQPPPDMKNIVEKTASFVAKNGPQFEQRILTNERNTTKFAFLQPTSPYFPYYQKKLAEFRSGLGPAAAPAMPAPSKKETEEEKEEAAAADGEGGAKKSSATIEAKASVSKVPKKRALKAPELDAFTVQPPQGLSIPSLDLDVIKLTAQYVAMNGRSFLNGLLTRENRNPQFDFLKGHHYLFGYFTSLVEAYSKVVNPTPETLEKLKKDSEDRTDILERSFQRLDWEAHLEKERQMNEDALAREKETAAAIDWNDFKVVETIDFNEDEDEDLPPPLSESELRAMRLKASTAQEAEDATKGKADDGGGDMDMDEDGDMDMDEGEDSAPPPPEPEPEPEIPLPSDDGPMKIVKDYQPGQGGAGGSAATGFMISPITGQQVPVAQMAEHMRIALLDPKWKEKSGLIKPGEKEDTLAQHDEVSANLARMASKRKDIFGTDEEVFGEPEKEKKVARKQDALQVPALAIAPLSQPRYAFATPCPVLMTRSKQGGADGGGMILSWCTVRATPREELTWRVVRQHRRCSSSGSRRRRSSSSCTSR